MSKVVHSETKGTKGGLWTGDSYETKVVLDDGRIGYGKDGGFMMEGEKHISVSNAIENARSKPTSGK